jgi:hypothetical protein
VIPREELSIPAALAGRVPRVVWHSVGLVTAVLLGYLIWRGYQSPDFLLDIGAALRLC